MYKSGRQKRRSLTKAVIWSDTLPNMEVIQGKTSQRAKTNSGQSMSGAVLKSQERVDALGITESINYQEMK
jgi:hypothetical protein